MNLNLALFQREWIQHRFSWALTVLIPLALAVLLLSFGDIEFDTGDDRPPAVALAAVAMAIGTGLMLLIATVSSFITVVGLARRDHADRSVEFWLSMPVGHTRSLLLPMVVHLVLVPLAAAFIGLLLGAVVSVFLVTRLHGFDAWLQLPFGELAQACAVGLARLLAGWPLFVLWLAPVVVVAMLMYAWMRRWGPVMLGLLLSIGMSPLGDTLGLRPLSRALAHVGNGAATALVNGRQGVVLEGAQADQLASGMQQAPMWLLHDVAGSLRDLASPVFVGGLLIAALCFYGLVQWRRRGASVAV